MIRRRFLAAGVGGLALLMTAPAWAFPDDATHLRRRIQALVVREAARFGVAPSLALAVADVESDFDPWARSAKDARGVMQILPATAWGEYRIRADRLWDPRLNVRVGVHFLGGLIDRYRGRVDLALSHYNGGSAVTAGPVARVIPATRGYVEKVRVAEQRYRRALAQGTLL